jgi:hypothetical protein
MSDLLAFKLHNFIYENHHKGVTYPEIKKRFPHNQELVKETFEKLLFEKIIFESDFNPGKYFSQLACDDEEQNAGCPICGSNTHSECTEIDGFGKEKSGLHRG